MSELNSKKSNYNMIKSKIEMILKEKYNIIATKIDKNKQSTDGNVYIIYSNDKKYVAKVYNDLRHTQSMIDLYRKLELHEINTARIISNKEKKRIRKNIR